MVGHGIHDIGSVIRPGSAILARGRQRRTSVVDLAPTRDLEPALSLSKKRAPIQVARCAAPVRRLEIPMRDGMCWVPRERTGVSDAAHRPALRPARAAVDLVLARHDRTRAGRSPHWTIVAANRRGDNVRRDEDCWRLGQRAARSCTRTARSTISIYIESHARPDAAARQMRSRPTQCDELRTRSRVPPSTLDSRHAARDETRRRVPIGAAHAAGDLASQTPPCSARGRITLSSCPGKFSRRRRYSAGSQGQ